MFKFITRTTFRQFVYDPRRITSQLPLVLPRSLHTTRAPHLERSSSPPNPARHTAESYFVDIDETPPPDPSTHRVDATSDNVQRPYEPPTGPWSRAGVETEEYRTMSREEPGDVIDGPDVNLRYGGVKRWVEDKGSETSHPGQGPEGSERWGRKPEGRG